MRVWTVHWISAALVVAVLLTALPFTGLSILRPSPRLWASIHLTLGWTLAGFMLYRLLSLFLARGAWPRPGNPAGWRAILKISLLAVTIFITVTGTVIYRSSPLQRPALVFGLIEAGPIISLDHAMHLQVIALHRYASFLLAALLAVHLFLAFKRLTPNSRLPISWLWLVQALKLRPSPRL